MSDLDALFRLAASRIPVAERLTRCGERPGRAFYRHCQLFGRLPVQPIGDDAWQPVDLRSALPHEERTILAVRAGYIPAWRIPRLVFSPVYGIPAPGQENYIRGFTAVWGPAIVDLVALPPSGSNDGLRCLVGICQALGDPWGDLQHQEASSKPILVAHDAATWVRRAMRGAVLPLGDVYTCAAYLRDLPAPLLVENLAYGRALKRLRRQPERRRAPVILVPPVA